MARRVVRAIRQQRQQPRLVIPPQQRPPERVKTIVQKPKIVELEKSPQEQQKQFVEKELLAVYSIEQALEPELALESEKRAREMAQTGTKLVEESSAAAITSNDVIPITAAPVTPPPPPPAPVVVMA